MFASETVRLVLHPPGSPLGDVECSWRRYMFLNGHLDCPGLSPYLDWHVCPTSASSQTGYPLSIYMATFSVVGFLTNRITVFTFKELELFTDSYYNIRPQQGPSLQSGISQALQP